MGISRLTALEVFNNPRDLVVQIGGDEKKGFVIVITRGPGHNYKLLIDSQPINKTREEVIEMVRELLVGIRELCISILEKPEGAAETLVAGVVNPGREDVSDHPDTLTATIIDRVIEILQTGTHADTSTF